MAFWQAFAERHRRHHDIDGRSLITAGISVNVHCRPYASFHKAVQGVMNYDAYDYSKMNVYIVHAETSQEAGRRVMSVFHEGKSSEQVKLVHEAAS
jgi:hypothetical protein